MVEQDRNSKNQKLRPQNISEDLSPDKVLDTTDPGDEVQRRFRYQHAYGVILLIASICQNRPYTSIWCEQHEDLLCQRIDGTFDAYQIKTLEFGKWNLSDISIKHSIKRFVELDQKFPEKLKLFYFVSNAYYENSSAKNKVRRCPAKFLLAVRCSASLDELVPPFNTTFKELCSYCDCDPLKLWSVLKRLDFITGPSLDSFEAEIAHNHLPLIEECQKSPALALAALVEKLTSLVYKASSRSTNDPARHWRGLNEEAHTNPLLQAKKITVEDTLKCIRSFNSRQTALVKDADILSENVKEILDLYLAQSFEEDLAAKLIQAGETDANRKTPLHEVFVDLKLKPRYDQPRPPHIYSQNQLSLFTETEQISEQYPSNVENTLSSINSLLREICPRIVIIGGPGQGKSTLGQYLAQLHRAIWLNREKDLYRDKVEERSKKNFRPKKARLPFRIILKYFAQWLADHPKQNTLETYIAEQICRGASRPRAIKEKNVHTILKSLPTLVIFDGLDEVTEQALSNRMQACIDEFLARAKQLGTDMQIIATSRPTSYKDQFTPRDFWHLELQPMTVDKVQEYAESWLAIKEQTREERQRIIGTLEECLQEEHTKLLLTTPLQVTIILLIIQEGGRPPAQREGLFQQYWDTILRREKSKGIIHADDLSLFNLHAHLGYLLHCKSASGNTRSLLAKDEFEQTIYDVLRKDDDISLPEATRQQVEQMVDEARTRLVLIVEPESGFYGFELRSFQEFFAGAYLAETAKDTSQRFSRLKSIAYSEHWRNVALFFAGRVVRSFKGESINILELVCRPINREIIDMYLCRGSWLALDIAADGVFTSNRNLQYSALELALKVLATGITDQGKRHLDNALQRLSPEDRHDILSNLLAQNISSLPPSCLPKSLDIYAKFINKGSRFILALEDLLASNKQDLIISAINLGFQHEVDPHWLAVQIDKYWLTLSRDEHLSFSRKWWFNKSLNYIQKILLALPLSKERAVNMMDSFIKISLALKGTDQIQLEIDPNSFSEQVVLFIQCLQLINENRMHHRHYKFLTTEVTINENSEIFLSKPKSNNLRGANKDKRITSETLEALNQLLKRPDLLPQLKVCLWNLYWQVNEPTDIMIESYLHESKTWPANKELLSFIRFCSRYSWPLLGYIVENYIKDGQQSIIHLQSYLNTSQERSISQRTGEGLQKALNRLSKTEQIAIVISNHFTPDTFPELQVLSEELGMNIGKLVNIQMALSTRRLPKWPPSILQRIFWHIRKSLEATQYSQAAAWLLFQCEWELDHEAIQQGMQLLHLYIESPQLFKMPQTPVNCFLKLLTYSATPLQLAPAFLSCLADTVKDTILIIANNTLLDIPKDHLVELANFTKHEDTKVQQGSIILWASLIKATLSRSEPYLQFDMPNLDWRLSLALTQSTEKTTRKNGILLLIYSHLPVCETDLLIKLYSILANIQDTDEIEAWTLFLKNVPIRKPEKMAWTKLLEIILAHPYKYTSSILTSAMERYIMLIDEADPNVKLE